MFVTTLATGAAWGFSSDPSALSRNLSQTTAQTNSPVVVTATFTNGGASVLRGFYYAEQIPSSLTVTPLNVTWNGQSVTNYVLELGQDGDVLPGCTPCRWLLETPAGFVQNHPLFQTARVQITYSLSSSNAGAFVLPLFDWSGIYPYTTNAAFGCSENNDLRTLTVKNTFHPAAPVLTPIPGSGVIAPGLAFLAESNVTYVVEYKPALAATNWLTLTNVIGNGSSASVVDPADIGGSRFYRVRVP